MTITPKTRLTAYANGPIRSVNGYQVGFYDVGILRKALDFSGEDFYRVGRLPIPTNEFEFTQVQAIINHPSIQYALVDKDKIVICQIGNNTEWLSIFTEMGYEVAGGGKTAKRLKSFHRPTLLNAEFDIDELNIVTVDCAQYSRYFEWSEDGSEFWLRNQEDYAEIFQEIETWDRLLDGGFAIHPRLIHKAIDNLPAFDITDSNDSGEYYMNPMLRQDVINDLYQTKVFNIRLIGPDGMIKGNCFVSDKLPEGVDVITWHGNIKTEIKYSNGWQLIAEPQNAKSKVRTDDQTVINMPQLFSKKDMEFWLDQEYEKLYNDAINNRLLMNWKNVYKRSFKEDDDIEDEETYARMQFVGWRWKAMDMNITDSPWLFQTIALSHAKPLFSHIPIPCSVSEQIISESMARLIGYDIEVEEGTIRRINDLKVHVVNDVDYMEMYESHGGNDHDDFFGCFYRTMIGGQHDGEKVVITRRSPNGLGEYSIFRYVEGEYFPTWTLADGSKVSFPEVTGRGWPMRLSVAIRANMVNYVGLPSSMKKAPPRTTTYTRQDVFNDIRACMIGGGVGGFVNATMLHSSVFHRHRPYQLCSMEDAIDGCVQTNDPADRKAIEQEAKILVKEVLDSGLPVDRVFWEMKNFDYYLKPGQWVEKYDGKITQLYTLMREKYQQYYKRIVEYSQTQARPSEFIHKFGYRLELHALPILNNFRMKIANANQQMNTDLGGTVDRSGWDNLYQYIIDEIESYENESDRHDLVLGLLSASLKHPTSAGKISDQIVMNRYVFPYLEKALQYYGLAKVVSFQRNKDNSIRVIQSRADQWIGRDKDGGFVTFDDALEYQRFRSKLSSISFSSVKTA